LQLPRAAPQSFCVAIRCSPVIRSERSSAADTSKEMTNRQTACPGWASRLFGGASTLQECATLTSLGMAADPFSTSQTIPAQQALVWTRRVTGSGVVAKSSALTRTHRLVSTDVRASSSYIRSSNSFGYQIKVFVSKSLFGGRSLCGALVPSIHVSLSAGRLNLRHGTTHLKRNRHVLFSAQSTMTGNIGQAPYSAANAYLDSMAMWSG
jgi:hypothetical protein